MRASLLALWVCAFTLLFSGCTTPTSNLKKPIPPQASDLFGTWVGLSEDGLYYLRMYLRNDGSGLCAYAYLHEEPKLLNVDAWTTQAAQIEIRVSPVKDDSNQIKHIAGEARATVLRLKVLGQGWETHAVLRREDDVERRAQNTKGIMEDYLRRQRSK